MTGDSTIAGAIGAMPTARATHEPSQQVVSAVPVGVTIAQIGNATLYLGDCRDILPTLGKVDAVIADIPYGTTRCRWDAIIPFAEMWCAIDCVAAKSCPIVLFGAEPFSSLLRTSNLARFKYDWVWEKPRATGHLNAKKMPMRAHEMVSVFSTGACRYYPQKTAGHVRKVSTKGTHLQTEVYGHMGRTAFYDSTDRYPRSVQLFSSDTQRSSEHPTQKPVALMEYLVATYSRIGERILDFTMGSGTTGVACALSGRPFIGVESDPAIFEIACRRIEAAHRAPLEAAA